MRQMKLSGRSVPETACGVEFIRLKISQKDNMRDNRFKKIIVGTLSFIVSAGLAAWLLYRIDLQKAQVVLSNFDRRWLAMAAGCACMIPLSVVAKWKGVLRAQKDIRFGFFPALRAVMAANVLNSFLPAKGGDVAKALFLKKHAGMSKSIATVVVERGVDFFVLGMLGIAGYFVSSSNIGLIAGLLAVGVIFMFVLAMVLPANRIAILSDTMASGLKEIQTVFRNWCQSPSAFIQTFGGSICTWTLGALIVCALTRAVHQSVSWGYVYSVFPIAVLFGLIPWTISGIGTRDQAFVMLFAAHMPKEEAVFIAFGYTLCAYWLLSAISLPFVGNELIRYFKRAGKAESGRTDTLP